MTDDDGPGAAGGLARGAVIDGWCLGDRLHTGGMAHIWQVERADDEPFPGLPDRTMPLVMKVPRIRDGEDPAPVVGFEVERMILPALSGPHVPRFVARGDFTRQPYIVMERIMGASLRPRLDEAPLPIDEVIELASRVATALHDLHRQGLIHLDIKPSNIVFRPDGTAVFVDFGLSRHDRLPDLLDEEFQLPMGTGPYISPEQVQFVRNDPRSDLFALGVMLYTFTTGQRPFGAPDTVRGLRRRLFTAPVPPRQLRPDCPPWLQEVILQCLEVDASRRWQSAAQLALAVQHPLQIPLTERATRMRGEGRLTRLRRWFATTGAEPAPDAVLDATRRLNRSPIVMAAVDIDHAAAGLLDQLRETVLRILRTEPGARLACVSVMKIARIGMDDKIDPETGQSHHVRQLVALKHWARPIRQSLQLEDGRLTFHVLEAADAGDAIIEFADRTQVDHIVMGARGQSAVRRYLGSVSARVVAQSACTVTVVKSPGAD